jgi:hypothetical protein
MKSLMLSSLVATILVVALAAMLSRPTLSDASLEAAAMPSLVELHAMAGLPKIPADEIEDQSLVFPTKPGHQTEPGASK